MAYRYVECGKFEGKTVRVGGVTKRSLAAITHIPKVGRVSQVRGYTYNSNGVINVAVIVVGALGTIRFGGFSWGYSGEGSRGLNALFKVLGIEIDATSKALGEWPGFEKAETHWQIDFRKLSFPKKGK